MDPLLNLLPVSVNEKMLGRYKYFCNETILHTKHGMQLYHMKQTCTASIPLTESQIVRASFHSFLTLSTFMGS